MKLSLSQSKIQSSLNFREVLQPQSVNKFTLYVCPTSRLMKQSHEFCTQRAEAPKGATQRKSNFCKAFARRGEIKKILLVNMINAIVSHIKSLCAAIADCVFALCVKIPKDYEIGLV